MTAVLWTLAPWACLAAVFWTPGIYLEWPSDPWEHLRRINEWHTHDTVMAHSAWKKSSYFLPYSLTGHAIGLSQINWLDLYYTAICLLLCWQYHRLARAVGLGNGAAFVFVLLNTLTFGNNIFSFYRYYGLSSSIFAQLGAVALIRIAVELLHLRGVPPPVSAKPLNGLSCPLDIRWHALGAASLLAVFTGFNHIQGIGIACLGILAVLGTWVTTGSRRRIVLSGLGALAVGGAVFLWFPRATSLEPLRAAGWLNEGYGFNVFSRVSPASMSSMNIYGVVGLINVGAGLLLLVRNRLVGWLTTLPIVVISTPIFAVPFLRILGESSEILVFHRMLFSLPSGLALVWLGSGILAKIRTHGVPFPSQARSLVACSPIILVALLVTIPTTATSGNRAWQLLTPEPADLRLSPVWKIGCLYLEHHRSDARHLMVTSISGSVLDQLGAPHAATSGRYNRNGANPLTDLAGLKRVLDRPDLALACDAIVIEPSAFYSAGTLAGTLSGHWTSPEAALAAAGSRELSQMLDDHGFQAQLAIHASIHRSPGRPDLLRLQTPSSDQE